jgi:aspartyl/asparaginyl beta-hydroxylase (cupin superfamily)
MIILYIVLAVIAVIILALVVIFIVEPSLIALPYSWILGLFVKNPPFVKMEEEFPNSRLFRENYPVIRQELEAILEKHQSNIPKFHEVDKIQKYISAKDEVPWRVFIFKAYGNWIEQNCALAPKTVGLLQRLPEVTTAMFSILEGRKHIPPHHGFYKGVLRYHMGMIIPEGDVYIIDGGEKYHWKEGEDVLFDDTFRHEVWNKTDHTRVVLFCDILRQKGIPRTLSRMNEWVYRMRQQSARLRKAAEKAPVNI